jgi:apolipoprotein D and lipocalin family protein
MYRVVLIAALALAGCTAKPTGPVGFRASDVPIWSAASFLPSRVVGQWQQAADFAAEGASCTGGQVAFAEDSQGLQLTGRLCLAGKLTDVSGLARPVGPGRLGIAGQEDWWVLWVDSGYRTMAIGTPSGEFGFVLDRGAISADRLVASREIFDFNGYAPTAFRAF